MSKIGVLIKNKSCSLLNQGDPVKNRTRVVVAMSGGVDSSVAASLLVEQGFEVIGVTMQMWEEDGKTAGAEETGRCSQFAVNDAARVAEKLGIPHMVLNFRALFEAKVVNYFITEYLQGRTPNPCVVCNRYIKFQALLEKACGMGAKYIATGHYARLGFNAKYGRHTVSRPADRKKDQTYVLYGMTQNQIARTMMPLGNYNKEQVRELASGFGLPVAGKDESQEICFIFDDNYRRFIRERSGGAKPGPFLNMKGEIIGEHQGIPFYTVGQRRGLGLATGERIYVVEIDPESNSITLGPEEAISGSGLIAGDMNLILYDKLEGPLELEAQVRYNGRPAPATLVPLTGGRVRVRFHLPQRSITPGQAVVFYHGDCLVGGATIKRTIQ